VVDVVVVEDVVVVVSSPWALPEKDRITKKTVARTANL